MNKMYEDTVTWNPFKGCNFDCIYCDPSFKRQAKRQKNRCNKCYSYTPHFHPERLNQYLPKDKLIFCCANGDISFATKPQRKKIFDEMNNRYCHTFLVQSKDPSCFEDCDITNNIIIGTTIETNRGIPSCISKAPPTLVRECYMKRYYTVRKAVTIEPIMDFDLDVMVRWIKDINPEIVWIGYNNYPESVQLDEPPLKKTQELIEILQNVTDVRLKTIREKIVLVKKNA